MPKPDPEKPTRSEAGKGRPKPSGERARFRAGDRRGGAEGRQRRFAEDDAADRAPRSWGSLARKGTRELQGEGAGPASLAWREAMERSRGDDLGGAGARDPWQREEWVQEPDAPAKGRPGPRGAGRGRPRPATGNRRKSTVDQAAQVNRRQLPPAKAPPAQGNRRKAPAATAPPAPRRRKPRLLPDEVVSEVAGAVAGTKVAARVQQRLTDATGAYERERYADALRMLKPLAEQAPGAPAVRELHGLTLYRLGRWEAAIRELEAFRAISDSFDQHPTLADCYRAKKRWRRVDELWEELRRASPAPALLAEGRLVMAGSLADRGRMADAIALLEETNTYPKKPKIHHLRTWYVLADLYERSGELPRARDLFRRILHFDADLYDVAERVAALGG